MPSDISTQALEPFRALIEAESGLQIPPYRLPELRRALTALMEESKVGRLEDLHERLASPLGKRLRRRLVSRMTVGESFFFRDATQFQALEESILPQLIQQHRQDRILRLWSAACSTGEEPYSLAILVHRLLQKEIDQWQIKILGTDINPTALAQARKGRYRSWSLRATPPDIRSAYFRPVGNLWELDPDIRRRVTCQVLNLVQDPYPSSGLGDNRFDLILCRNVLIYFKPETSQQVVDRLYERLSEQGLLLVGFAEHLPGLFSRYERVRMGKVTFYRRKSARIRKTFPGQVVVSADGAGPQQTQEPVAPRRPPLQQAKEALELWDAGQRYAALALLDSLLPARDMPRRILHRIARAYADARQWTQAEQWLDYILAQDPLNAYGYYLYGLVYQATDRPDEALDAFRRAVYLDGSLALAHFALAGLLLGKKQFRRAAKALDQVERLLQGRPLQEKLAPNEKMTVGELLAMVRAQRWRISKKN